MKNSLRSLMLVVALVALVMGWWAHRSFCLERAAYYAERSDVLNIKFRPKGDALDAFYKRTEREYRRAVWQPWLRPLIDEKPPKMGQP